jgi:predicted dinucleotide-binding enzyme
VFFQAGDNAAEVGARIDRLGFFGIDFGSLAVGSRLVQLPGGSLPALNSVKIG